MKYTPISEIICGGDRITAFSDFYDIVKKLAETMEECGHWPDTSHSQAKLGDLGREARDLLDNFEGSVK